VFFFCIYFKYFTIYLYKKYAKTFIFIKILQSEHAHICIRVHTHTHTLIQTYVCVCSSWQWFCCWCCVVFDIFPDDFTAVADISLLLILLLLLMLLMFVYNKEVQWRSGCNHINFLTMYVDIQIFQHKFVLKLCS